MASARLQITVESATNLYNADGVLAGKSDPYVIVEVPGQESMKFQTEVINNDLNPVWNCTGEIAGFMDGDVLQFTVMDKDTWPKPDQLLGKVSLMAADFYPDGFHAGLQLDESKTNATLQVKVLVLGCDELGVEENNAVVMTGEDGQLQAGMPQTVVEGGSMGMVPGEQSLLVNVMNARGLYNADGFLAGKSDPYCICMIPEKPEKKFQTAVISNCLDPEWNHTGRIDGFQAGDSLEFQVWDSDTFPKPDQLLGKVLLTYDDFAAHPDGLTGVLQLTGGKSGDEHGTLEICIQTMQETAPMGQMEMQVATGGSTNVMVTGSTGVAPGTVMMAAPTTTTYSAPSVPGQVAYSSYPTTQTMTYGAPQAGSVLSQPSMTYPSGAQFGQVTQAGSMSMMSQPSMTYSAPGVQTGVQTGTQTGGKVLQVIVHPPVTVTAQEFAQSTGTIVSTPLPVTTTATGSTGEGILETMERGVEKVVKIKKTKKKSKSCC